MTETDVIEDMARSMWGARPRTLSWSEAPAEMRRYHVAMARVALERLRVLGWARPKDEGQ